MHFKLLCVLKGHKWAVAEREMDEPGVRLVCQRCGQSQAGFAGENPADKRKDVGVGGGFL